MNTLDSQGRYMCNLNYIQCSSSPNSYMICNSKLHKEPHIGFGKGLCLLHTRISNILLMLCCFDCNASIQESKMNRVHNPQILVLL